MRMLAIDCATEACSVALFEDGALLAGTFELLGRGHAERLIPMIAELPERGKAERITVSLGPGSFTSTRIGLAAAKALALAWKAQAVGYATHALIAAMARQQAGPQPVTVATTGGHGEWFVQNFDDGGAADGPIASLAPGAAAQAASAEWVAGSQAQALIATRGWGAALPLWPDARAVPLLAERDLSPAHAPIYGRAPDAKLPGAAS